jgi:hypothetical protein
MSPPICASDRDDAIALAVFTLHEPGEFPHVAHVRVARLYVQQLPLGAALDRFTTDLRRFATAKGASGKYHETISVAFVLLICAGLGGALPNESFAEFLARNPELATPKCLLAFYTQETLASQAAREHFVFPDRGALTLAAM